MGFSRKDQDQGEKKTQEDSSVAGLETYRSGAEEAAGRLSEILSGKKGIDMLLKSLSI